MSKAGERLLAAAQEALSIAKGEKAPAATFIPPDIDVRAIRQTTKLNQEDFAATFGFTLAQIRDWEQQRSRPLGGVRAYLMLIAKNHEAVIGMIADMHRNGGPKGKAA